MSKRIIRIGLILLTLLFCLTLFQGAAFAKVKIGVQPWLGYGPWWIAEAKGFFEKHHVDAEIVNFTWDQDMSAALASGHIDFEAVSTNQLISLLNQGVDVKAFMLLDASFEADAILSPTSVQGIKDLKGKSVAYEYGSTSELLLMYALSQNGMTKTDIDAVPMAAADAGLALVAGRVNVAVTYEPYISAALRDRKEFKVLYTAAERPSLISDVMMAQTQFIEKNPEVIKGMILAWNDSIQFLRENFEEGGKIIADAVGSPMDEFKTAFDGVRVYNLAENGEIFLGGYRDTFVEVGKIMHGVNPNDIKKVPTAEEALAVGPLKELLKK